MIAYEGNKIVFNGTRSYELPYPILDLIEINGDAVVLFHPDAGLGMDEQFRNICRYNPSGCRVWECEMPTGKKMDAYYQMSSCDSGIKAQSVCSYDCIIDECSGSIIEREFFK